MHKYRDIHEYHDKCYYCLCSRCETPCSKKDINCEFCEGGELDSKERCINFVGTRVEDEDGEYLCDDCEGNFGNKDLCENCDGRCNFRKVEE